MGRITSMSMFVGTPCMMAAIRSRPMPVSIFLDGKGASRPSSWRSNCWSTRFQTSTKRCESFSGVRSFGPFGFVSTRISVHGPHGPLGPFEGADSGQKFSSSPNRQMRASGTPISSRQMPNVSSSSSKMVTCRWAGSCFISSSMNCQAHWQASRLK